MNAPGLSRMLAMMLIGLGLAILVRTIAARPDGFAVGYLLGPALVAAGIARIRLGGGKGS